MLGGAFPPTSAQPTLMLITKPTWVSHKGMYSLLAAWLM
jgi:hypothetical protein